MNITALAARYLKKWPALYRPVEKMYFALKPRHLMEMIIGTKAREQEWATRHNRRGGDWNNTRAGDSDEWITSYWESRNHPSRAFLVEKIAAYYPFKSAFEVGCNCGPNLYLIGKRFPDVLLKGIDINSGAVKKGIELLAAEGIKNAELSAGKADELEQFPDKSFDVTFTHAVLLYIGPDKIDKVIRGMLRVSRKALVLLEWQYPSSKGKDSLGKGIYYHGMWARDYAALLKRFVPENRIKITPTPPDVWTTEEWKDIGAVIEVSLD